jgi:hypothetical protein
MDAVMSVRLSAASLMAVLGVLYLVFTVFSGSLFETQMLAPEVVQVLMILTGLVCLGLAVGLFTGRRLFEYFGAAVPLALASAGIVHYTVKR